MKVVGGDIPEEGALELKPECQQGCGLCRGSRSLRLFSRNRVTCREGVGMFPGQKGGQWSSKV